MSLIYQKHLILPYHSMRDVIFESNSKVQYQQQMKELQLKPKKNLSQRVYTEEPSTIINKDSSLVTNNITTIQNDQNDSILRKMTILSLPESETDTLKLPVINSIQTDRVESSREKVLPKRKNQNSFENVDVNKYLGHLNSLNRRKKQENEKISRFLTVIEKQQHNLVHSMRTHSKADSNQKFTAIKSLPKRIFLFFIVPILVSLKREDKYSVDIASIVSKQNDQQTRMNQQKKQQYQQLLYDTKNKKSILAFQTVVKKLILQINLLKEYLNNGKKLFFVLKKLIGVKKHLYKNFLNEEGETIIDPLTEQTILKSCSYKDQVFEQGDVYHIDCINFSLIKDLEFLVEKCYEMNLQIKVSGLTKLQESIFKEQEDIADKESKMEMDQWSKIGQNALKNYRRIEGKDLKVSLNSMKRYQPHAQLEELERRFGSFERIQRKSKVESEQLSEIIKRINNRNNDQDEKDEEIEYFLHY